MTKKKDITRIEDLSEFLHEDDPDADNILSSDYEQSDDENDEDNSEITEDEFLSLSELDNEVEQEDSSISYLNDDNEIEENNEDDVDEFQSYSHEESEISEDDQYSDDFQNEFEEENDYQEENNFSEDGLTDPYMVNSTMQEQNEPPLFQNTSNDYKAPVQDESQILSDFSQTVNSSETKQAVEIELSNINNNEVKTSGPKELINEVKHFSENYTYNIVPNGGSPSFSIVIENIAKKYHQDFLSLIKELMISNDVALYEDSLKHNRVLVSQIGEYQAILLANKMSRKGALIKLAPSELIHQSSHYDADETPITQNEIYYHQEEELDLSEHIHISNVVITTTDFLQGFKIQKYLGIAQEFVKFTTEEVIDLISSKDKSINEIYEDLDYDFFNKNLLIHEYHDKLKDALIFQAKQKKGNAIIGLNYTYVKPDNRHFEITCTGTIVYAVKIKDQSYL